MSKKEVKQSDELFPKPPPGYRPATPEEELEILKRGTVINSAENTLRRCEAEIRAAKLEMQSANRQLAQSREALSSLHAKLGIAGAPGDLTSGPDGKMYILADKAKRDAAIKRAKAPTEPPTEPPPEEKPTEGRKE